MSKAWKQMEREMAKLFNTERSSYEQSKKKGKTSSDTNHPRLYIECKRIKRVNLWLLWYRTLCKAKEEKKLPVLVLKHPNLTNRILVCRIRDVKKVVSEMV